MELFVTRVVKCFLHIFSTIILMYGIFLVVCGLMIVHDMRSFSTFIQTKTLWLPYLIAFAGIMMIVLPIFGFWATQRQDYKLLVTFLVSAVVVLLIEVAIVTWVSANNSSYKTQLKTSLDRHFKTFTQTFVKLKGRRPFGELQYKLRCCGVNGPNDWNKIYSNQVPSSCCVPPPPPNNKVGELCLNTGSEKNVHQQGCHSALSKRIGDHWSVVSLLAALAAFAQVILLILSISMAFLFKRAKIARERD